MRASRPVGGRKILPPAAALAWAGGAFACQKPLFYWVFGDGTPFADHGAVKLNGRAMRHQSEFP
jgi:hypothetical protein